jgi:hypothetical protein
MNVNKINKGNLNIRKYVHKHLCSLCFSYNFQMQNSSPYAPPYARYNYTRYSELIPSHTWRCFKEMKCTYPCPYELPGYGKIVYLKSHLCLSERLIVNRKYRILEHQRFKDFEYKNVENSSLIGKTFTEKITNANSFTNSEEKNLSYMFECSKTAFCIHCKRKSNKCICEPIQKAMIRPGVDGPMNCFYKRFFCSECYLSVNHCNCKNTKFEHSKRTNRELPKRFVTNDACNCNKYWTFCSCTYMPRTDDNKIISDCAVSYIIFTIIYLHYYLLTIYRISSTCFNTIKTSNIDVSNIPTFEVNRIAFTNFNMIFNLTSRAFSNLTHSSLFFPLTRCSFNYFQHLHRRDIADNS